MVYERMFKKFVKELFKGGQKDGAAGNNFLGGKNFDDDDSNNRHNKKKNKSRNSLTKS